MAEERRYANLGLVRDLLPALDNVQRAIEAAEKSSDAATLLQGFKMVGRQLESLLERYHCVKIEALHQPFDPSRHEAIAQQPSADVPPKTVIFVAQPATCCSIGSCVPRRSWSRRPRPHPRRRPPIRPTVRRAKPVSDSRQSVKVPLPCRPTTTCAKPASTSSSSSNP